MATVPGRGQRWAPAPAGGRPHTGTPTTSPLASVPLEATILTLLTNTWSSASLNSAFFRKNVNLSVQALSRPCRSSDGPVGQMDRQVKSKRESFFQHRLLLRRQTSAYRTGQDNASF